MTKNKKIFYGVLAIGAATLSGLVWFSVNQPTIPLSPPVATSTSSVIFDNNCDTLKAQIEELKSQLNYCQKDTDCQATGEDFLVCPFGCYLLVNKEADISQIKQGIEKYGKTCPLCLYECPYFPKPSDIKCISNKCVDIRFEPIVTITTDKTEYKSDETIKVTIINNETPILYFADCRPLNLLSSKDNTLIKKSEFVCEDFFLTSRKEKTRISNLSLKEYPSDLNGSFKLRLNAYKKCDETIRNWQMQPDDACEVLNPVYSNEFRIK